ncbi:MAG: glycoside hydrolase family 66 protein [Candidatus Bathyarchaeota archaeon]|nr:glycoside hydrolase family 66 protein [Candidatus Bathyarchaeota archaeon]
MQKTTKIMLVILALSSMLVAPVAAQTKEVGIYGIWTDKTQYNPGETVIVTLELGWDFPAATDISPGVFDTASELYVTEDYYTVEEMGMDNITLSFTAPATNAVYEYIVDVYYDDGDSWIMSDTGYEAHYIYIQVGSTGSAEYNAWVTNVDAPSTVKPGELFTVDVDIDISFPTNTTFSVGITDPETGEVIIEFIDAGEGDLSGAYNFEIYAPETEGDYTLGADVVFETPSGWSYTEGGTQTFNIKVSEGGGAIPGFPVYSILAGSLVALAFAYRKQRF